MVEVTRFKLCVSFSPLSSHFSLSFLPVFPSFPLSLSLSPLHLILPPPPPPPPHPQPIPPCFSTCIPVLLRTLIWSSPRLELLNLLLSREADVQDNVFFHSFYTIHQFRTPALIVCLCVYVNLSGHIASSTVYLHL